MSCLIPRLPLLLVLDDWIDAGVSGLSASEKLARWGNEWYLEIGNLSMLINDNIRRSAAGENRAKISLISLHFAQFEGVSCTLSEHKVKCRGLVGTVSFPLESVQRGSKTNRPRQISLWNFGLGFWISGQGQVTGTNCHRFFKEY